MASLTLGSLLLIVSPFLLVILAFVLNRIDESRGDGYITIGGIR